ncbi:hypothetical protein [Acinetobacter piscicola]|uniref:hypothetical protein n=1 Tax=Acinetobacter piscicola TaxID=2006115 RepID=UPI000B7F1FB5|nr:hypothetical protein [Acinetobacter piscicola]
MRSWVLLLSAISASLASVFSLVLPLGLFLRFYHGNLFVSASERMSSRAIEVLFYLTPFLVLFAFFIFLIILSGLKAPKKVFEIKQIFKAIVMVGLSWFSFIFLIQFLDGVIHNMAESLFWGMIALLLMLLPLTVGIVSGNVMYFIINKRLFCSLKGSECREYKSSPL